MLRAKGSETYVDIGCRVLATGGAFTTPGYSTHEKCKAAESELVGELNNANEQIGGARPILNTVCKASRVIPKCQTEALPGTGAVKVKNIASNAVGYKTMATASHTSPTTANCRITFVTY
jgi:hypothetical protein